MALLLGAIADDYTGGSDLAGMMRERGVRTVMLFGVPDATEVEAIRGRYEAVVLCLKSRSIPPEEACAQSLDALRALQSFGARQIQFKYCSTFDSTPRGNIGPVTNTLLEAMQVASTVAVPALPVNKRTQYLGNLFVGSELLSESPMRHHPLNPMTESNLVRHLQAQTTRKVRLIDWHTVQLGPDAIRDGIGAHAISLVDVLTDADLGRIAEAVVDLPLITGGSGLGMALPYVWRQRRLLDEVSAASREPAAPGGTLVLSGSCSAATLSQLAALEEAGVSSVAMNTHHLLTDWHSESERLSSAARTSLRTAGVAVVRSSEAPASRMESEHLSAMIERCFGAVARTLAEESAVTRVIVAGGETSGAVVNALGIRALEITGTIDPGVPSLKTLTGRPLWLALKSGNFGAPDFFVKTMRYWDAPST